MTKILRGLVAALFVLPLYAAAGDYAIDPMHSIVTFEALHNNTSTVRGRFERTSGKIRYDARSMVGSVDVSLDTGSLTTGVKLLDSRLREPDYFDVEHHPVARFISDEFKFTGASVASISGVLTLLGRTAPVELKARRFNCYESQFLKREVCGGDFEAVIKRSQWGMQTGIAVGIPDDIRLQVQVEAISQ